MFCVSYKEQLSFISRQHWTTGFGLKYNHLISATNCRVFLVSMIMHFRFRHQWRKHFVPDQEHRQKKNFIQRSCFPLLRKAGFCFCFRKAPIYFSLWVVFFLCHTTQEASCYDHLISRGDADFRNMFYEEVPCHSCWVAVRLATGLEKGNVPS